MVDEGSHRCFLGAIALYVLSRTESLRRTKFRDSFRCHESHSRRHLKQYVVVSKHGQRHTSSCSSASAIPDTSLTDLSVADDGSDLSYQQDEYSGSASISWAQTTSFFFLHVLLTVCFFSKLGYVQKPIAVFFYTKIYMKNTFFKICNSEHCSSMSFNNLLAAQTQTGHEHLGFWYADCRC